MEKTEGVDMRSDLHDLSSLEIIYEFHQNVTTTTTMLPGAGALGTISSNQVSPGDDGGDYLICWS